MVNFFSKYYIFFLLLCKLYGNWSVAPMSMTYELEANTMGTDYITIKNPSTTDTLTYRIVAKDYIKVNGNDVSKPAMTTDRTCAGWLFISPETGMVLPGQNLPVRVDLTVPEDSYGDYWAMLYIEQVSKPRPQKTQYGKMSLNVYTQFQWGVRVKQHVPGSIEKSGKITSVSFIDNIENNKIEISFLNDSKLINKNCTGWVEIRDEDGDTIYNIPISSFTIYPDDERTFSVNIPSEIKNGEYSAVGILDFGGDHLVGGEILFNITSNYSE